MNHPKLCYVQNNFAYFTTQPLDEQWGDDWDDAPYEHNAGEPYTAYRPEDDWEIIKVAFDGNLVEPSEGSLNSFFSVKQINQKHIAWLRDIYGNSGVAIHAGTTIEEFITLVKQAGGKVYMEVK